MIVIRLAGNKSKMDFDGFFGVLLEWDLKSWYFRESGKKQKIAKMFGKLPSFHRGPYS